MLKNNPRSIKKVLFGLKTLSLIAISPLSLISCTVDTPTTEYNHQVKILSSNDATYLLNRDYYDLILASGYRLSLAELRKRFKDTKSREFQDLLRAFRI